MLSRIASNRVTGVRSCYAAWCRNIGRETQSRFAERLLVDWDREIRRFWQVVPIEMIDKLEHPVLVAADEEQRA